MVSSGVYGRNQPLHEDGPFTRETFPRRCAARELEKNDFHRGLRLTGLAAPFVHDRPMSDKIFQVYVERVLIQTLKPGDIVVMDNLPTHTLLAAQKAIERAGAELILLPPYSPDFSPTEMAFSKLKVLLRVKAEQTVGARLPAFTPSQCDGFFTAAGYGAG